MDDGRPTHVDDTPRDVAVPTLAAGPPRTACMTPLRGRVGCGDHGVRRPVSELPGGG